MSLTYDLKPLIRRLGRDEYDRVTQHPDNERMLHPVTNAVIWIMPAIGVGEITEDNLDLVWQRACAVQSVVGTPLASADLKEVYLTKADFERHIGLRTNIPFLRTFEFRTRVFELAVEDGGRLADKQGRSALDVLSAPEAAGR